MNYFNIYIFFLLESIFLSACTDVQKDNNISNITPLEGSDDINGKGIEETYINLNTTFIHNGISYKTVTSPYTQRIWLDRNLGASRVCTSFDDDECYGDYYQWGRYTDGHEKSDSNSTSTKSNDINSAGSQFITSSRNYFYDWTNGLDLYGTIRITNWHISDGTSICPTEFRVPTIGELRAETIKVGVSNKDDAFNSFLKLPSAGYRDSLTGTIFNQGTYGSLWSTSPDVGLSQYLHFGSQAYTYWYNRADGRSVRCIKEIDKINENNLSNASLFSLIGREL